MNVRFAAEHIYIRCLRKLFGKSLLYPINVLYPELKLFFAGEPRRVEQALDEYSDIYSDIIDESEDFLNENDPFNMVFAILERLNRLQEKHLISCVCGSTDAEFDIEQGDIIMRCCRCGRTKKIKVSEETLTRILNTNAIIIDN